MAVIAAEGSGKGRLNRRERRLFLGFDRMTAKDCVACGRRLKFGRIPRRYWGRVHVCATAPRVFWGALLRLWGDCCTLVIARGCPVIL